MRKGNNIANEALCLNHFRRQERLGEIVFYSIVTGGTLTVCAKGIQANAIKHYQCFFMPLSFQIEHFQLVNKERIKKKGNAVYRIHCGPLLNAILPFCRYLHIFLLESF